MAAKMTDDPTRFVGKPIPALQRFAKDLEASADPDEKKFQELNRARIDTFIRKPYENTAKYKERFKAPKTKVQKQGVYDYTDKSEHTSLHLDAPELQRCLGPRSRYGDGDGSFWDKWINSEMPSKGLGIDEKGLPIAGQAEIATMGYKRLYNNRSHDKVKAAPAKPRTRAIIQPYSERKAKRLEVEAAASETAKKKKLEDECRRKADSDWTHDPRESSPGKGSSLQSPGLSGADWREVDSLAAPVDHLRGDKSPSPVRLPPVTALERDAYFGHKARAEFLDIFRQLSRQRHVHQNSKYNTDAAVAVSTSTDRGPKGTKIGRSVSGGGRFNRENPIDEDKRAPIPPEGTPTRPRSMRGRQSGVQTFGQTGVLVRTGTKPNVSLDESAQTEENVLNSHLKITSEPGSFPRPLSPRSRFLLGCLNSDIVPRPSMLIRKELTYVLNLEHQYIGDHGGLLLANSLNGLPYLAELNVGDNNLTDRGLTAIIEALHMCPHLTSLDVSENKIDEMAASALSGYLQKRDCQLINLVMRKSDVDDNEIGDFVQAIGESKCLKNIDLSANLIGSNQNRSPLHPGLTAGGKVLGDMLSDRSCRIESLKLAWNMIRFESGVALMQSLKENHSLTYLDVSYNGLGQEGAEMLGDALHVNTTLRSVLVSNNNITPRGCVCIVSGVRSCRSLGFVDISNNPIGEKGAQAVMMLITEIGERVRMDIRGCSIRTKDDLCWYDPEHVEGSYVLNMAQPYERTVAVEMLRAAAASKGKYHLDLKYVPDAKIDSRGAQVLDFEVREDPNCKEYEASLMPPQPMLDLIQQSLNTENVASFLKNVDAGYQKVTSSIERNGKLTLEQMEKLLNQIGWGYFDNLPQHILASYDIDSSHFILLDELKEFFISGIHDYVTKWTDAARSSVGKYHLLLGQERYLPSDVGSLLCRLRLSHQSMTGLDCTGRMLLKAVNMDNILQSLKLVDNAFRVCQYALTNCSLNFPEAWRMYLFMVKDCGDKLMVLRELLPLMSNVWDARVLLHQALENDVESRVSLRGAMGPLYRISVGQITGFYSLQLSKKQDRQCFILLTSISRYAARHRKTDVGKGDISQHGDWQGFRNCILDGAAHVITKSWVDNLPEKGKVEFDFVLFRNATKGGKAMTDERYFQLLGKLQMLPVQSVSTVDEDDEILMIMGVDELILAPLQQHMDGFQHALDELEIPGVDARPDVLIEDVAECERMTDYYNWCVENCKDRERGVFPKKFAPQFVGMDSARSSNRPPSVAKEATSSSKKGPRSGTPQPPENEGGSLPPSRQISTPRSINSPLGSAVSSTVTSPRVPTAPPPPLSAEYVVECIGYRLVSCQQLAFILHNMGEQDAGMFVEGLRKPFGSTRVEVIITLFNQIYDMVNFPTIAKILTSFEKTCLIFRLGWLAIWNPLRPDGVYTLNLKRREERQMVRILIALLVAGQDAQWNSVSFTPPGEDTPAPQSAAKAADTSDDDGEATWKLPPSWQTEHGLPNDGTLRLRFHSDSLHSVLLGVVFANPPAVDSTGKRSSDDPTLSKAIQWTEQQGLSLNFGSL